MDAPSEIARTAKPAKPVETVEIAILEPTGGAEALCPEQQPNPVSTPKAVLSLGLTRQAAV
jgi:hypothetical protein